jgi:hypothetical protein
MMADVVPVQTSSDPQSYLFPLLALLVASVSWLPLVVPLSLLEEQRCQRPTSRCADGSPRTHVLIRDDPSAVFVLSIIPNAISPNVVAAFLPCARVLRECEGTL